MVDIDSYLTIIDNDKQIQEKLKLLADDVFNNNEFLSCIQPVENAYFSELVDLLGTIIRQHKDIFSIRMPKVLPQELIINTCIAYPSAIMKTILYVV